MTLLVLLGALALIFLVFRWSGRHGDRNRGSGTSLRRGPNAHTTKFGQPKVAYGTRDEAIEHARAMTAREGAPLSAYRCATCAKWHLGRERS